VIAAAGERRTVSWKRGQRFPPITSVAGVPRGQKAQKSWSFAPDHKEYSRAALVAGVAPGCRCQKTCHAGHAHGLLNAATGRRALYGLPMGFATHHVHVWRNLLEQAGFTLAEVPKQWEAFWSFWCDRVQPAVRKALGRNDIYGVGLAMSAARLGVIVELADACRLGL
jgi:hypothetical protein